MFSQHRLYYMVQILLVINSSWAINHGQALLDWNEYKTLFNKNYSTATAETTAQYYYHYNKNLIAQHNALADRNVNGYTYRVAQNQFTDIRYLQFAALLPKAVYPTTSNSATPTPVGPAPDQFDFSAQGFSIQVGTVHDQGTVCSSSWAYATAKASEILNGLQTGNLSPEPLSAQGLIDCAGSGTGCTTQVPQIAFDYLTQYANTELLLHSEYPNNNTRSTQGMCTPGSTTVGLQLRNYATITDGDDTTLMRYVASGTPVIVEYNPGSFGFMHYKSGIYQPAISGNRVATSSQFLLVLGYGYDSSANLNYWLCLNSFGTTWGENGYIRILRTTAQPIAQKAIFPNEFA